jgi:aldehyde:ferredoxin oxidoreductase
MDTRYGWAGKILKVDLSEKKITTVETAGYAERFIGGMGIGEKFYWDESTPGMPADDPHSPLLFMTGPLAATPAPSAPRLVVCGKSPALYPEAFNSASIAGSFTAELKRAGYDGIVVTGKASQPLYLTISSEAAELKDAAHLWGLTNSKTRQRIRETWGEKTRCLTIGPGAENGSRIGTIATDAGGNGSRGFGSLMGWKKLKAIAVRGSGNIAVADPEKITAIRKAVREMRGEGFFNLYGKPLSLSGVTVVKQVHCQGCPQGCWRTLHQSPSGEEGVRKCQTPLFYSFWSSKYPETSTEVSFRAASLVDDYSLCVIEMTFLLLWLEKCIKQGILSDSNTGLSLGKLGSMEFFESMLNMMCSGEGFGKLLAQGVARAAEAMGAESKAIADSDRPMPYGPKTFIPSALLYAVEPRPPITELHEVCHPLTKWGIWYVSKGERSYVSTAVLRKIADKFWGSETAVDFSTYDGKALAAKKIQERQYAKECLVLCDFAFPLFDNAASEDHVGDPLLESKLLSAVTGEEYDEARLHRAGERVFNLNRAIHLRDGRKGRSDDCLPETQFIEREERIADVFGIHNPELYLPGAGDEVISRKGKALDRVRFETMLEEYYRLRGWDPATGFLKEEALRNLDLPEVIDGLPGKVV